MKDYSFYLFCMLVNDSLIHVTNLEIPYDQLYKILINHYQIFQANDNNYDVSEYEAMENYIKLNSNLLDDLMVKHNEYN